MKKIIICLSLLLILFGCVNNDKQKETHNKPEEVQEEQELRGDNGNYRKIKLSDLEVENNVVSLQCSFAAYPTGLTYAIHVLQNGVPIPFSFEKDGEYATMQFKTFENENNRAKVYIHPYSFKKDEKINFGMAFHNNPDYIPEIQEFTRYPMEQQFSSGLAYLLTAKISYKGSEPLLLENLKWEQTGEVENPYLGSLYYENDSADVLKGLAKGNAVNDANVMHLEKGEELSISIMQKLSEESIGINVIKLRR